MIVIATNNGYKHLKDLLDSMSKFDFSTEKLLVIDTISNDENHLNFLQNLQNIYPNLNISISTTPYRKFDTGAYLYAYKNFDSEYFIFLHDSITIKDGNFIQVVKDTLKDNDIVSFSCFNFMGYGDQEWKEFFKKNTNEDKYEIGIFGPMFACKKSTLDKINFDHLELPNNKNQQACYEGIWPTIFLKNNLKIYCMDNSTTNFQSKYLTKKIIHRD
jgi:hypothetical protein